MPAFCYFKRLYKIFILPDPERKGGNGYIFSKSVKTLPATEKTWVLLENDYVDVKNKKGKVEMNEKAIENAKKLAGYNMIVTSEKSKRKTLKILKYSIILALHNQEFLDMGHFNELSGR